MTETKTSSVSNDFRIRSFIGTHDKDWSDKGFHQHPSLEISIVLEGSALAEHGEHRWLLESGEVVIMPAWTPHRFEGYRKNRLGLIHLENVPERLLPLLRSLTPDGKPARIALSRLDKERFERLFREWLRILSSRLKEQQRSYTAWIEVLLLFFLEHSSAEDQALTITKAADYIREHLAEGVQIGDLASLAGLTESAFRRQFEWTYGLSPKQYQHQCRMAEAKWLLSSSDKDIQEIAEQIGFHRLHSFSQWFKLQEGISPSEWRKMQRDNFI
ncbi:helix-turn-helix domain-containing protein [Paenibacillus senegalensis]|uniref:helix-turn-helix domain-containing protein n=1 Tax=Paenibacillus senegalensis TaxID=1465766 RepID=UPI000288C393|nr:AraC family transcriptional regulator [Paenibacillus senegalensis]